MATREYAPGIYYCDECFNAIINNLMNIAPATLVQKLPDIPSGPFLPQVYQALNIPSELQFGNLQTTCRNQDKLFNHHAIAIVNLTEQETATEIEQLSMSLFQIEYRIDALKHKADKIKEERRREKGLVSYDDSKEQYSKPRGKSRSKIKDGEEEKLARKLGLSLEQFKQFGEMTKEDEKKKRERQFNILADNCPECGGPKPCDKHPQ